MMPIRLALALFLALPALPAAAAQVDVYLFWGIGCPHCGREIEFLDRVAARNAGVRLHKLEVSRSRANAAAMRCCSRDRWRSCGSPSASSRLPAAAST